MEDNSPAHVAASWVVTILLMAILLGLGFLAREYL